MKKILLMAIFSLLYLKILAQISLTTGAYTQDFNTLANTGTSETMPAGWYFKETGNSANTTYTAGTGSSNTGDTYSFGTAGSTNRTLGSLRSGNLIPSYGASFTNNTGSVLTQITISYKGQTWRIGTANRSDRIDFLYSTSATSVDDGTYTDVNELDYSNPGGATANGSKLHESNISHTITGLNIANGATFWIKFVDADATGADDGMGIDDFSLSFPAANPNSPSLVSNPSSLSFGNQNINTVSTEKPLELTYSNLTTADLTLSTVAPFSISKTSNGTYSTSLTYENADRTSPTTLYVKYTPTSTGAANDNITISGAGLTNNTTVTLTGNGIDPNITSFNFENCAPANNTTLSDGFTQYSVVGAQTWACTTFGHDASDVTGKASAGNSVQINGYSGSNIENRDWLISPVLNLSTMNFPLLSFWSRTNFNGDALQLKYSTNYSGTGNPELATWVDLDGKFPITGSDTWTKTQNIDLTSVKNQTVYVAFVYNSSTSSGSRWTIDDFEITNSPTPAPTELNLPVNSLNFGYQVANTTSTERTFTFSASNISGDIELTAPANFTISKTSGGTFVSNLTYAVNEANNVATTVYAKFSPTTNNNHYNQNLTIATAGIPNQTLNLTGNTFNTNSTLEAITWNIEWFGASGNGPSNKPQQAANIKTVFNSLQADIYGLQEIVDTALFRNSSLPAGYNVIFSDFGSYADHKNHSGYASAQKLAFMYRTDIIKPVQLYGILRDTYYPNNLGNNDTGTPYKNWSSGRFPFLMEAKVTINNVEETIYFITLHAKANTGDVTAQNDSYDRRKGGSLQMKQWIDNNLADKKVIMFGDFNDVLNPDKTIAPKPAGTGTSYSDFTLDNANYFPVSLALSLAGKRSTAGYNTVIDNVIINKNLNNIYLSNSAEVLDNVTQLVTNYSSTTTDHYPIQTRYFFQDNVLPVKFDDFTAKQEGSTVTLRWSTASETNNQYFTIERSNNGSTFERVREVASKGNSNKKNTYSIIDNSAKQGLNYYRLKQTDLNGDVSYFPEIRSVNILDNKNVLLIYPNPAKDKVTINYVSTSSNIELSVLGNDGKLIFKSKGSVKSLEQQLNSKIASIPSGLYIISFTENGISHREKLVKQ